MPNPPAKTITFNTPYLYITLHQNFLHLFVPFLPGSELLLTPGQLSGASAGRSSACTGVFSWTFSWAFSSLGSVTSAAAGGVFSTPFTVATGPVFSRLLAKAKRTLAAQTPAAAPTVKVKTWEFDMAPGKWIANKSGSCQLHCLRHLLTLS